MAEAVLKTEQVERTIVEDREVVVVTMSREEAELAYSAMWLTEFREYDEDGQMLAGVRNAIARAINWPLPKLSVDTPSTVHANTVYIKRK